MSGDFFDSNVIIYLFDDINAHKRDIATQLIEDAIGAGESWISFQVVQEVLHVFTRKLEPRVGLDDARRFLDNILLPLWRVMPSERLYRLCLDIQERYRYGFYDSLIIAAAVSSNCDRLFSEDLQSGQRIENLTIANPFA